MAVSAITSYSSALQYSYFGTAISAERLQKLLSKYGIQQTGDNQKDLQALYDIMYARASVEAAGSVASLNSQGQEFNEVSLAITEDNSASVPWADLMKKLGLTATGDLGTDYAAFLDKINKMQTSAALTPDNQFNIDQLLAEASVVFAKDKPSSSQTLSQYQTSTSAPGVTGADIQAQLNKIYFFG